MRKLIAKVSVGVVLMAQAALPVLGADAVSGVVNSGDGNNFHNKAVDVSNVNITNNQTANVSQDAKIKVVSGQNNVSGNISPGGLGVLDLGGGTSLETGEALGVVSQTVSANDTVNVVDTGGSGSSAVSDTTNTGDGNHIDNLSKDVTNVSIRNNQTANVDQSCGGGYRGVRVAGLEGLSLKGPHHHMPGCEAISGQNGVEDNIGSTTVVTGPAGFGVDQSADVNHIVNATGGGGGLVALDGEGSGAGSSVANTGDGNHFHNKSVTLRRTRIGNMMRLNARQYTRGRVVSGQNDLSGNIGPVTSIGGAALGDVAQTVEGNDAANAVGTGLGALLPLGGGSGTFHTVVNTGDGNNSENLARTRTRTNLLNNETLSSYQRAYMSVVSGQNDLLYNIGGTGHLGGPAIGGPSQTVGGNRVLNEVGTFFDVFLDGLLFGLLF